MEETTKEVSQITITSEKFDEAIKQVVEEMVKDPKIEGMAKLFIPTTGVMFARDMKKNLIWRRKGALN